MIHSDQNVATTAADREEYNHESIRGALSHLGEAIRSLEILKDDIRGVDNNSVPEAPKEVPVLGCLKDVLDNSPQEIRNHANYIQELTNDIRASLF